MRFRLGFGCATLHCGHRCAMRSAPPSVPLPLAHAQTEARSKIMQTKNSTIDINDFCLRLNLDRSLLLESDKMAMNKQADRI